jgi:hypothetical protein
MYTAGILDVSDIYKARFLLQNLKLLLAKKLQPVGEECYKGNGN